MRNKNDICYNNLALGRIAKIRSNKDARQTFDYIAELKRQDRITSGDAEFLMQEYNLQIERLEADSFTEIFN